MSGFRYAQTPRLHASAEKSARAHALSIGPFGSPPLESSPSLALRGLKSLLNASVSSEVLTVGAVDCVGYSPPIEFPPLAIFHLPSRVTTLSPRGATEAHRAPPPSGF